MIGVACSLVRSGAEFLAGVESALWDTLLILKIPDVPKILS